MADDIRDVLDSLNVPKETKAAAWNAYQTASSGPEFVQKFSNINLPRATKSALWKRKFEQHDPATGQPVRQITGRQIIGAVGEELPMIGGAIGGAVGAGLPGMGLGGIAGQAGRELIRQRLGKPVPQTTGEELRSLGEAGAEQVGYGAIGEGISPMLKAAGRGIFKGIKEMPLPSGETFPTTPGTRSPESAIAKFEAGAAGLPGGFALRDARREEIQRARQLLINMAKRNPQGAKITATEPAPAFNQASLAAREMASPMHEAVAKAMSSPTAADPTADAIKKAAQQELHSGKLQSLLSRPDLAASVKQQLESLAGTNLTSTAGSSAQLSPGDSYKAFRDTLSTLRELGRTSRLSRNEKRIVSSIADKLDDEIVSTIRHVGGPKLEETYREANRLTAKSYALEDVRDALRASTKGAPEGVQPKGVKPITQGISGRQLEESLKKLATVDSPRGKSVLSRALTSQDEATIVQIANYLKRSESLGGGTSIAAKFRTLEAVSAIGGTLLGHPAAGLGVASAPEIGAYVFAQAMTSRPGRSAVLGYLSSPTGSANEARFAATIGRLILGPHQVTDMPEQPTVTIEESHK